MDERQVGLALALRELGTSSDVSDFDSRLILQKTVYLMEVAGIRLGYPFTWYLRGPYSPALTRDLFGLPSSNADVEGWVLDSGSQNIAQRIQPLIKGPPSESTSQKARRLELAASLHYLASRRRVKLDDPTEAVGQLAQNGKHFSNEEVAKAIEGLRQAGLL